MITPAGRFARRGASEGVRRWRLVQQYVRDLSAVVPPGARACPSNVLALPGRNSVRLGSSPRALYRVGGLWAFGRGSGQQGQFHNCTPQSRLGCVLQIGVGGEVTRERLPLRFPSLSFRVDLTGHCAEGGGSEVLMQVTRSLSARIRTWSGLLGKRPAKVPYGAGAWGR